MRATRSKAFVSMCVCVLCLPSLSERKLKNGLRFSKTRRRRLKLSHLFFFFLLRVPHRYKTHLKFILFDFSSLCILRDQYQFSILKCKLCRCEFSFFFFFFFFLIISFYCFCWWFSNAVNNCCLFSYYFHIELILNILILSWRNKMRAKENELFYYFKPLFDKIIIIFIFFEKSSFFQNFKS